MSTLEFYHARAAECGRDADQAPLDNVRERYLRSQEAWLDMARRVERGDAIRAETAASKAATSDGVAAS
ncbi:MAG: hypothetical protein JWM38_2067 [Sphingomonas bacterium]|jgi:hypothetical protein|nr:hypothetical protein [Sphingomonas bacterium]MDB5718640.1 hypothetical protein [Sphingomonas bacterium]